jgi:hypothetical protein
MYPEIGEMGALYRHLGAGIRLRPCGLSDFRYTPSVSSVQAVSAFIPARWLAAGAALACASCALGQSFPLAIEDPLAYFRQSAISGGVTGSGPTSVLSPLGPDGPNFVNQAWWWGRVEGQDVREFAIFRPDMVVTQPASNHMRAAFNYTVGSPLRLTMDFVVTRGPDGTGLPGVSVTLRQSLTVQNTGTTPVTLNLFNFNNVQVNGTPSNDLAIQTAGTQMTFLDGEIPAYRYIYTATGASAVQAGSNIRTLLTNSSVNNLVTGVAESGPGNLEVAAQYTLTIAPGQSQTIQVIGSIVPGPGTAALLGLAGLMAARRRRR